MKPAQIRLWSAFCCVAAFAAFSQTALAKTLCVNPGGTGGCYATIQAAVTAASPNDVVDVAAGTYAEQVVIRKSLSLIGAGYSSTSINATNFPNGVLLDGLNNPGLHDVTVAGFTIENALYEGVLVLSTTGATIRDNHIINNDKEGPNSTGTACVGQPSYETDEGGDCGGGLHLMGAVNTLVSNNTVTGNADGILISDETGESHNNVIVKNGVSNNARECGIVLASHPPVGSTPPNYAAHHGVDNNTIWNNISNKNGLSGGGAGVGLFSDGEGPGKVTSNSIVGNTLTNNSLPGVALHSHKGPATGQTADNMYGNMIIANTINGNGTDVADSSTNGLKAGINISSGHGGSPVRGTVITLNVISSEQLAVGVNTPAELDVHFNTFPGGQVGVANDCTLDGGPCTGSIDATDNYWGCSTGPGTTGCSTVSGSAILSTPWLSTTPN